MQCHNVFHISKLRPCSNTDVQPDYIPVAIEKERQDFIVDHIVEHDILSHPHEMVSTSEDHAWCLKYDGLDMMSLPTHGKHISLFDECKLLIYMLVITLASRSYALLQDILIFTRDTHRDFRFLIVEYI